MVTEKQIPLSKEAQEYLKTPSKPLPQDPKEPLPWPFPTGKK